MIIKPKVPPIFEPLFTEDYQTAVIMGGRGKGATQAVSKLIACMLMENPKRRGVVIRNEANKIDESIYVQIRKRFAEVDEKSGGKVSSTFAVQDRLIKNRETGESALFLKGVRASTAADTDVFKGLEDVDFAIVEEAQQVRSGVPILKLLDTGVRFDFKLILLLNTPDTKDHWIIQDYFDFIPSEYEGYGIPIPKKLDRTIQILASYKDNPYLNAKAVKQYESHEHKRPHWYYHQILGLIPMDSGARSIVKRTHKESWRDSNDKVYDINHSFIKRSLQEEGFFFAAFDGGEHTNRKAAVLGYHVTRYKRDILLKEFKNQLDVHDLREVALQVREFMDVHNLGVGKELKLYGDPVIFHDGVHSMIENVFFGKTLNCLEGFRKSENKQLVQVYQLRKQKRLARLGNDIYNICSDNKPQVIILKEDRDSFGCPQLYAGLFDGLYRYELDSRDEPTKEIEQFKDGENKHLTDICDAYTYFILAERPFSPIDNEVARINDNKIKYSQARVGW